MSLPGLDPALGSIPVCSPQPFPAPLPALTSLSCTPLLLRLCGTGTHIPWGPSLVSVLVPPRGQPSSLYLTHSPVCSEPPRLQPVWCPVCSLELLHLWDHSSCSPVSPCAGSMGTALEAPVPIAWADTPIFPWGLSAASRGCQGSPSSVTVTVMVTSPKCSLPSSAPLAACQTQLLPMW